MDLIHKALAANSRDPSIHLSRGNLLLQQCRMEDAIASYQRALRQQPDMEPATTNIANALQALRRTNESRAAYRRALELMPDDAETHFNLAMLLLSWQTRVAAAPPRTFIRPQWYGEPAQGRTLLVHAEQGFGDTLHFCRYVPLAAARGLRVVVQAPHALLRLLLSVDGVDQVVPDGASLPPF